MKIQILAFGIARDILGKSFTEMELDTSFKVTDLRAKLLKTYPDFEKLVSLAFAVNEEYRTEDFVLNEGDEVAIIPPVAGG